RGRKRPQRASCGRRERGRRDARPGARRRGARVHRAAQGPGAAAAGPDRDQHRQACPRAPRVLQGAGLHRVRRRAAAHPVAEDPARRAARAGAVDAGQAQLLGPARAQAPQEEARAVTAAARARSSYEGVAVACPVTVPYRRYSTHGAHWWIGRAMDLLVERSGIAKERIDGLTVSSFSLVPDTAVGVTQHLGLSPRWLDHIPTGGASGVMALRRAARAVQCGDADLVVCLAADTNHIDSFRQSLSGFSRFSRDAVYPYGFGGPNATFALITDSYMREYGVTREDFGKLCVAQ